MIEKEEIMIKIDNNWSLDKNSWNDGNYLNATFCVTEDCNLRCTYCYMVGKNKFHRMDFDTAKNIVDFLMNDEYSLNLSDSIMLDFIGGEPLLEIDLIDRICDYFLLKAYKENHKWFPNYMFTFSTNGILYGSEKVREFIKKHSVHSYFSMSIDGTKEKHDMTRVDLNGKGSYDRVIKNLPLYMKESSRPSTKSTFSSPDLIHLKDSIIHLWELGFKDVESNLVYEDVWKEGDPELFESQLMSLADYVIENRKYDEYKVAYFSPSRGLAVEKEDLNKNRCGAGYKSLAFDWKGNIYPCIRFLEMCDADKKKMIIGNIKKSINYNLLRPLAAATWESISPEKCNVCEFGTECGWCLAHSLSEKNTIMERCTYICEMHKANARANKYFWTKYERDTGNTSKRTIEKLKKQTSELKYLYIITSNNAPAFCNYSSNIKFKKEIIDRSYIEKGIDFCTDNEMIPIFLGGLPSDLDMKNKIYFEIVENEEHFPISNGVRVFTLEDIRSGNIYTNLKVVNLKIERKIIKSLSNIVDILSSKVIRINIFIEDIEEWGKEDFSLYEHELESISNIICSEYSKGKINFQVNVLTDRIYIKNNILKDCGAGINSLTLAPDSKLYVCPAYYFDNLDSLGNLKFYDKPNLSRKKSSICSSCLSNVCNRCLYLNKINTGEELIPTKSQCMINHIEANKSVELARRLDKIIPKNKFMNRNLTKLNFVDYVDNEIYKDKVSEVKRWE